MLLNVPRRHIKYTVIICLSTAALFYAAFARYNLDGWFRSSGDKVLARMNFTLSQPHHTNYTTSTTPIARKDATLISLVRNEELDGIISSMRQLESAWNHRYNYPWIFFNNVPFTDEFKERTQAETNAECRYELIPPEHWDVPDWIDKDLMNESMLRLKKQNVKYAGLLSYHQMCRWNSGFFYRHPALDNYKYYWRVEPDVKFFCTIPYDPFEYLATHNKSYGFTINIFDIPATIPSLWPETISFLNSHSSYLAADNSLEWLTDRTLRPERTEAAHGYSTCHFWSNFEIADLDVWRGRKYEEYFEHLDQSGGFFYERWGDAPVHSIALGLFEDNSRIHWFRDIGYEHPPYINCPDSPTCNNNCQANKFTNSWGVLESDCRVVWFKQMCKSRRQHNANITPDEEEICRQLSLGKV